MNPVHPLLEQLHDIEGLDVISKWPLAIGWWVVIACGVLFLCTLACLTIFRILYLRSWKNDTKRKLSQLETRLSEETSAETVKLLSEYLRRIAVKRFSRKECAGLSGEAWLKWLLQHDPKEFDWVSKGVLLIEAPYAPTSARFSVNQIKELIQAVREWVR